MLKKNCLIWSLVTFRITTASCNSTTTNWRPGAFRESMAFWVSEKFPEQRCYWSNHQNKQSFGLTLKFQKCLLPKLCMFFYNVTQCLGVLMWYFGRIFHTIIRITIKKAVTSMLIDKSHFYVTLACSLLSRLKKENQGAIYLWNWKRCSRSLSSHVLAKTYFFLYINISLNSLTSRAEGPSVLCVPAATGCRYCTSNGCIR